MKQNLKFYYSEKSGKFLLGLAGFVITTFIVLLTPIVFLIVTLYPFLWWSFAAIAKAFKPISDSLYTLKKPIKVNCDSEELRLKAYQHYRPPKKRIIA
jgi:TM2 domain-containing membrane protein YozV